MRGAFHALLGEDAVYYLGELQAEEHSAYRTLRSWSARGSLGALVCMVSVVSEPLNSSPDVSIAPSVYTRHDRGKALKLDVAWLGASPERSVDVSAPAGVRLRMGDQLTRYSRILLDHHLAEQPLQLASRRSVLPAP